MTNHRLANLALAAIYVAAIAAVALDLAVWRP
jgi:hypothetical protein